MEFKEIQKDIFTVDSKYVFAHCISGDYILGKGIAVEFEKRYNLKDRLNRYGKNNHPDCIFINPVFNLVTKSKYWHKPTYESIRESLELMKEMIIDMGIKYLAMPTIGCVLDRLKWEKVKEIIKLVFYNVDIEILICKTK